MILKRNIKATGLKTNLKSGIAYILFPIKSFAIKFSCS